MFIIICGEKRTLAKGRNPQIACRVDNMDILQAIILGAVQAVTEWLPLSSKTMDTLVYAQFFGGEKSGIIPVLLFLHIGTMLAAAIFFRKEIVELIKKAVQRRTDIQRQADSKTGFLVAALLCTGAIGLPILAIEQFILPDLKGGALLSVMGAGLVLTGFMLTAQHKNRWRNHETASWKDGVLTGALQGISALPGVSRAGATTTALVWRGFDAESAFHLSFLLSIPTVFCMEVVLWLAQGGVSAIPVSEGLALALSSFLFGYLTIGTLTRIAHRINIASLAFLFGMMMLAFGLLGVG